MLINEGIRKKIRKHDSTLKELIIEMNKGFEMMEKLFETIDKRFEDMNRTFMLFLWLIGIGITFTNVMIGILIALKVFN